MRRIISLGPALIVLATASSLLWFSPQVLRTLAASQTEAQILLARRTIDSDDILERLNLAIRAVADSVEPSVVHIDVLAPEATRRRYLGATGSGWIFDSKGHIVTNAHVVRGSRFVRVQLYDGRANQATIVGIDPFTDIAVLKIKEDALVAIPRATDDRVYQGDRVFAFGSPFGFKFSMSEGIVSGLGRAAGPALDSGGFTNFIQTDAAVNPGNSGGPLVDIKGRIVGMNVAIATAKNTEGSGGGEGQSSGISFAIPLVTIENVVQQLIDTGKVSRGFLGISYDPREFLDEASAREGISVRIPEDGPAARAGLKDDDKLVSLNGQPIKSLQGMRSLISNARPGDTLAIEFTRAGEKREASVIAGEMPTTALIQPGILEDIQDDLGLSFEDPANPREYYGATGAPLIVSVNERSQASDAGLREGDRIVRVGDQSVSTIAEAVSAMVDQGLYVGKPVHVTVRNIQDEAERSPTFRLWGGRSKPD
ncbi:MAG: trypsin-like peptidase domain-containing protein [Phycisphaeraceae bacterium]|nr:trypsin-like peptidase domain-containing protein [Phycisphaeraceae bacterium]